jgi:hypothetical protein
MRSERQHRFNSLHIYCRCRDLGIPRCLAKFLGATLGFLLRPLAYGVAQGAAK